MNGAVIGLLLFFACYGGLWFIYHREQRQGERRRSALVKRIWDGETKLVLAFIVLLVRLLRGERL